MHENVLGPSLIWPLSGYKLSGNFHHWLMNADSYDWVKDHF